ncbi:hypothetical protein E4U43_002929 [Claviceps pusilla]|uniref:non-specific serine/threonine protein kinase n=1 Tax=Claviceps pusilla TaxID=123648 RepID=A0A9P7N7M1_9HYPO|nr:hypothetical protein E4U43_002929 [Claviceps pusilla]
MSEEIQNILLRLQQAEKQRDQALTERDKARTERDKARTERDKARTERDKEMEKTRPTTLSEYLKTCHDLVFARLTVEERSALTTKGSIRAYEKLVPGKLKKWTNFIDSQKRILRKVSSSLPSDKQLFDNRAYLAVLGNQVSATPIANEKMLENFMHNCVERPVTNIINALSKTATFRNMGSGIIFDNHPKAISDMASEVVERKEQQRMKQKSDAPASRSQQRPKTPDPIQDPAKLNADQICIYLCDNEGGQEKRIMVAIAEYKPPHKLSIGQLRAGLREMDILKDVVSKDKDPVESPDEFQHDAEELTAAAITQTYHYMIKGGLSYSLLTTGQAIVFLKINWKKPDVLYYHLAEPVLDVRRDDDIYTSSAVAQYVAFHLTAIRRYKSVSQEQRHAAISNLNTWVVDFRDVASTISKKKSKKSPGSLAFRPSNYKRERSEIRRNPRRTKTPDTGSGQPQASGDTIPDDGEDSDPEDSAESETENSGNSDQDDEPEPDNEHDPDDDSKSDDTGSCDPPSPCPRERRQDARGTGAQLHQRVTRKSDMKNRNPLGGQGRKTKNNRDFQYCTQRCLLGLLRGYTLDFKCPNFSLHNRQVTGQSDNISRGSHPVSYGVFLNMLHRQLEKDLDSGITSLDITGARGALFKVTLLCYGYTFIGKGTVKVFVPDLEHEAIVYKRLERIQGTYVPVFLGAIDLQALGRTYYYDLHVDVVHISFMSYGGICLSNICSQERQPSLLEMATESVHAIHREGVIHMDVALRNMLYSAETQHVMLIDFERSEIRPRIQRKLAPLSPNKRRRTEIVSSKANMVLSPIRGDDQLERGVVNDVARLEQVLACF